MVETSETHQKGRSQANTAKRLPVGTKRPFWRKVLRRLYTLRWQISPPDFTRTYHLRMNGFAITVLPSVFHPRWHFTSSFLAEHCREMPMLRDARVLEIGTGTGVVALAAARYARQVVAIDINPEAVRCARLNAEANSLQDKVDVRLGDMFEPVRGESFNVILCNPPYFRGAPHNDVERAFFGGENLEWISRFAEEARPALSDGGRVICVFGDAANVAELVALVEEQGWRGQQRAVRQLPTETLSIWEFRPQLGEC